MNRPALPRLAATVMLLRDDPDLRVLLLERSRAMQFVPGAHVFPGGAVEEADHAASLPAGLDPATARRTLDHPGAVGFWVAAIRECFEETGILLAVDAQGRAVQGTHPARHPDLREAVEVGELGFEDLLRTHDLTAVATDVAYAAHWITPESSPRRYDTRFFAAPAPPGQDCEPDGREAVGATWWRPTDALAAWDGGDIQLIEPTVASLRMLASFPDSSAVIGALQAGSRHGSIVAEPGGGRRVPVTAAERPEPVVGS